jgi:hypothetical protein
MYERLHKMFSCKEQKNLLQQNPSFCVFIRNIYAVSSLSMSPAHSVPLQKHLLSSSFLFSFIKHSPLEFKIPPHHEYRYLHFVYDMKFKLPLCLGSRHQGVYLGSKTASIFQLRYYLEQRYHLHNLSHLTVCMNYSCYKILN